MAISDQEKLDFLWKAFQGVSKTAGSTVKAASNETIPSPTIVYPTSVWQAAGDIPAQPPTVDLPDVVNLYIGANRVHMTGDPTSPPNVTWLATSTFGQVASTMGDFIPPTFGSGYAVRVFIGNPNGGPAARIFPDTTNEEWVFNYGSGVLTFPNNVPAQKAATVGSGNVTVAANGIYIEVYRYAGEKGVGGDTDELGTMALQDADAVDITGGAIDGVTITNAVIDGGRF